MRVAYIGNFQPAWSTENDIALAWEAIGWEVTRLQENATTPAKVLAAAKDADLLLITGTWDDALPLPAMLDVFHDLTLAGVPTATMHLDTFWPVSRGGRRWWLHPMFHTGNIFTASGDDAHLWDRFGKRHHWLPPAVRHTVVEDVWAGVEARDEWRCDVAFVGSDGRGYHEKEWPYRRQLVAELRAMCKRRGWSFRNPGGSEEKIGRQDMAVFYAGAKVTVGDSLCPKKEDSRYWSDRVPEATGRQGLLIMPQIDAVQRLWPDMPMYPWGDFEALEGTVERLLGDEAERHQRRLACFMVTDKWHTYVNRVRDDVVSVLGLAR